MKLPNLRSVLDKARQRSAKGIEVEGSIKSMASVDLLHIQPRKDVVFNDKLNSAGSDLSKRPRQSGLKMESKGRTPPGTHSQFSQGIWRAMNLSRNLEKQNLTKQSLRLSKLASRRRKANLFKPPNSIEDICPENEREEYQKFFSSIRKNTPVLEELFEEPDCPPTVENLMSKEDMEKLRTFVPPVTKAHIENSLFDEFQINIKATNWKEYSIQNASILQAAVMMQSRVSHGKPISIHDVAIESDECIQLSNEIQTGDYSRYSSPSVLLKECYEVNANAMKKKSVRKQMLLTAYHLGFNSCLHPDSRKDIMKQVFAVVSKSSSG